MKNPPITQLLTHSLYLTRLDGCELVNVVNTLPKLVFLSLAVKLFNLAALLIVQMNKSTTVICI